MGMEWVIATVIGLAALVGCVLVVRGRTSPRPRGQGATSSLGPSCLFCLLPIARTDQVAALNVDAARAVLGRVPSELVATTDPLGNRRWLGHLACATAAGVDLGAAVRVDSPPPPEPEPARAGELTCPSCRHSFVPPAITVVTTAIVKKYGRDPVQCPRCDHIWNQGRKPPVIRG